MSALHDHHAGRIACIVLLSAVWCEPLGVFAQEAPAPDAQTPASNASAAPSPPTGTSLLPEGIGGKDIIFYLYKDYFNFASRPDQVVLTREKYEELLARLAKPKQVEQSWSITELALKGRLDNGNETRLSVDMQISIDDPNGAVVDLKMQEASFENATTEAGEPAPIRRTADGSQLVINKKGVFRYHFELFVFTERTPTESRIQLTLPAATVKRAELTSKEPILFARDSRTDEKLYISEDRHTIRPPLRAEDSLKIAWRSGMVDESPAAPGQRVHGVLSYQLDGSTISTEALLTIDLGVQNQSCSFRIPLGEQVRSVSSNQERGPRVNFELTEESDFSRLLVKFEEPATGQVRLRVVSDRTRPDVDQPCQLGFFELEGAESQTGVVLLLTKDDLWVRFDPKQGLRSMDMALLDADLQKLQPARAYQYNSQPAILELQLQTEPMVTATSETRILTGQSEAQITSKFHFFIRQAETGILHLRVPSQMQIEAIGPVREIKQERTRPVEGVPGMKEVPLVFSEDKLGKVPVELHGTIPLSDGPVNILQLPTPSPDVRWSGSVTVETEEGLTLEVDDQKLQNLRREPLPTEQSPDRPAWHFRHDKRNPILAFKMLQLPERVEVAVDSKFQWKETRIAVESVLRFRSSNRRLTDVVLQIPKELASVKATGGIIEAGTPLTAGKRVLQLNNPTQQCDILVSYEVPISREGPLHVDVPLVLPETGVVSSYKGTIWCEPGMRVGADPPWQSGAASANDPQTLEEQPNLVVVSNAPPPVLGLRLDPSIALAPLVIPRVVIEDVLLANGQHSGIVRMLIATHRVREVRLLEPPNCKILGNKVSVNGEPVELSSDSVSVWRVRLPATDEPCSLEIPFQGVYPPVRRLGSLRKLVVTAPSIADDVAIQEVRWVIRSKRDLLVVDGGAEDFSQLRWRWLGYLRPPASESPDAATQWLRAGDRDVDWSEDLMFRSIPAASIWTRQTWGNAQSLTVWTVPHSFWILVCSGLMLVVGLSVSRSMVAVQLRLLAAVLVLTALGVLVAPQWTMWIWFGGQWGFLLAAAAIVFRHLALRRRRVRYMIGRTIGRHDAGTSSLSSLIRRLHPEERSGAKLGTTIDA